MEKDISTGARGLLSISLLFQSMTRLQRCEERERCDFGSFILGLPSYSGYDSCYNQSVSTGSHVTGILYLPGEDPRS